MKKFFSIALLVLTSVASATEISENQYKELLQQNSVSFENVTPGMIAEYHSTSKEKNEKSETIECFHSRKEVVISTNNKNKYLVYVKSTALNDCVDEAKGEIDQYLTWKKLEKASNYSEGTVFKLNFKKIEQDGVFVFSQGETSDVDTGEVVEFSLQRDLSQSQFYNLVEISCGNYSASLLRRGYIDPTSINIENLEVVDSE